MKKSYFWGSLLVLVTLFLYYPSLEHQFFQDDFYTLINSRASSVTEFLRFFVPGDEIYYRPLSMRVYFWLVQNLFGVNPLPFHILSLMMHVFNGLLVWKFIHLLTKNNQISWVTAYFYSTSSIHFINLYWISETGLVMGITWYLLSCISFLSYLDEPNKKTSTFFFLFFLLGILSHEFSVTLPVTLFFIAIFHYQSLPRLLNRKKHLFRSLVPLVLVDITYLLIRFVAFPISATGTYAITFGRATLKSLFWYLVWSFNILENIKDQVLPGLRLRPSFYNNFPKITFSTISTLVLITIFLIIASILFFTKTNQKNQQKLTRLLTLSLGWFAVTISIPLLAPDHLYPIYSSISSIGLWLAAAGIFVYLYSRHKYALPLAIVVWTLTSFQTIRLTEKTHWTTQESEIISRAQHNLKTIIKANPQDGSTFVVRNRDKIKHALFDQLGLQVLIGNPTINTHYGSVNEIMPVDCQKAAPKDPCLQKHNIYRLKI